MIDNDKKTGFIGIKATPKTIKRLKEFSRKQERSMSFVVNKAVISYLEAHE